MFNLYDILWVVPGVIFVHFFNKNRPTQAISLSGWPYVFFIVVIAALTWLPAEFVVSVDFIEKFISDEKFVQKIIMYCVVYIFCCTLIVIY